MKKHKKNCIFFVLFFSFFNTDIYSKGHFNLLNDPIFKSRSNFLIQNKTNSSIPLNRKSIAIESDSTAVFNFKPNAIWLGYNHNMYDYKPQPDVSDFHNSWAVETGVGKYYYEREEMDWILAGGGIGLEYRQLFNNSNNAVDAEFNRNLKNVYLNIRAELGFGFEFLDKLLCLHGQLGFTTNFSQNYIRPGIGISLGRLQFGYEAYWGLNTQAKTLEQSGVYWRYIITPNEGGVDYKQPIDWDGRL